MRESEVVRMIGGLRRAELRRWVAAGWIAPQRQEGEFWFRQIDVARLHMIVQIRRDMRIAEDSMPLVLSLVDQVYGLRNELRQLAEAVEAQPETVRRAITEHRRRGS
ncbi:MAG: chaperone modulator CbpM [Alphaproteobacteria bacterium]|nr:chaperone modulator CbpM [Alphaproteobacteria bacterium]